MYKKLEKKLGIDITRIISDYCMISREEVYNHFDIIISRLDLYNCLGGGKTSFVTELIRSCKFAPKNAYFS